MVIFIGYKESPPEKSWKSGKMAIFIGGKKNGLEQKKRHTYKPFEGEALFNLLPGC